MATNQELRHASVCDALGITPTNYNADWSALFDDVGIPEGPFNGRFLAWINDALGTSYTSLPGAMQAYAADQGFASWDDMGTFTPGGGGNDPDAEAYFTAVGGLDATHETAINTLIVGLKAASLWTATGRLRLLANQNATAALTCLKTLAVGTNVGTVSFAADAGYTPNGTSNYLNMGLVASPYAQNSAFFLLTIGSNEAMDSAFGDNGTKGDASVPCRMAIPSSTLEEVYAGLNGGGDGTFTDASLTTVKGHWLLSRTGALAAASALYRDGAAVSGTVPDATGVPDDDMYLGAVNNAATPDDFNVCNLRAYAVGSGLDATQAAAYTTLIEAYLDAIGAGVIT